jgi:hypothetical protein
MIIQQFLVNRCRPFDWVEHAALLSFNTTVGGLAVVKCDQGYAFQNGREIDSFRCLPNLTWERPGHCLGNTDVTTEDFIKLITPIDTLNETYQIIMYFIFRRIITANMCPTLVVPRFGTLSTNIVLKGTSVEVTCKRGYMFTDRNITKTIICDSSLQWNDTVKDCIGMAFVI